MGHLLIWTQAFTPSSHFASFNNGASFYSRTTGVANSYEYGVQATGGIGHNVYVNYSTFGARWHLQCTFADRPVYSPTAGEGSIICRCTRHLTTDASIKMVHW